MPDSALNSSPYPPIPRRFFNDPSMQGPPVEGYVLQGDKFPYLENKNYPLLTFPDNTHVFQTGEGGYGLIRQRHWTQEQFDLWQFDAEGNPLSVDADMDGSIDHRNPEHQVNESE